MFTNTVILAPMIFFGIVYCLAFLIQYLWGKHVSRKTGHPFISHVIDLRFGYSPDYVKNFLTNLGAYGRRQYFLLEIYDFFYALCYLLLGISLALTISSLGQHIIAFYLIAACFIAGFILDVIENIGIIMLLKQFDKNTPFPSEFIKRLSLITMSKLSFLAFGIGLIIFFGINSLFFFAWH